MNGLRNLSKLQAVLIEVHLERVKQILSIEDKNADDKIITIDPSLRCST